jgi:hypothetical protein
VGIDFGLWRRGSVLLPPSCNQTLRPFKEVSPLAQMEEFRWSGEFL